MAKEQKRNVRKVSLITGATSALGIAVVRKLVETGEEVRVIIRDKPELNPEWKNLPRGVKPYVVDLASIGEHHAKILREACSNVTTIFHFASLNQTASKKFSEVVQINVIGTENLLKAYLDANAGSNDPLHIIYTSSTAVYGYNRKGEIITEKSRTAPVSSYGESKLMGEQVIKAFAEANKRIKYTILRIGVIYGNGYNRAFNRVFRLVATGRMRVIGNGENHLSLIHIDDVVEAIILSSENSKSYNKLYNLTDGVRYTQKELLHKAAHFLNTDLPEARVSTILVKLLTIAKSFDPVQIQFITSDRIISIEKIKKELGFSPKQSMDVQGKLLVEEFLKQHKIKAQE